MNEKKDSKNKNSISLEIYRKSTLKDDKNDNNLLCDNVQILCAIIQWIEMNIFLNNRVLVSYWKINYLFKLIDEWILLWININTPVLQSLLYVPQFNDNDNNNNNNNLQKQKTAIQHINHSIAYRENIENALNLLTDIIEKTQNGLSKTYLCKSLELLSINNDNNEYGLSSSILSSILPSKIREFIFSSIRNLIKNHDYEEFNRKSNVLFAEYLDNNINNRLDNNNILVTYNDLISSCSSFFHSQPCVISRTMYSIVFILYNIIIFIEQMYYIVDYSNNDIINLSTMYVDLFMNISRNIIQLWISLSISYHSKFYCDVSSLGFQFYNDCSFLNYHLLQLSIKTNNGNALITDNIRAKLNKIRNNCKYIWFIDYFHSLKNLAQKYFIHHLHNQRQIILKNIQIINQFYDVNKPIVYDNIVQSLNESLMSISRFLNGSRSTIPDNLLYQIGGKLLECICNAILNAVTQRISDNNNKQSDIGLEAAHNISRMITHISKFEILSNDLDYMTRNIKIWKRLIQLGEILHKDQSLLSLTEALDVGELDVFERETINQLICALFNDSPKRKKFIEAVENRFIKQNKQMNDIS